VAVHQGGPPYSSYGLNQSFALTTSWNLFTFTFTTPGFGSPVFDGRLRFSLSPWAQGGDQYDFDNVSLALAP